MGLKEDVSAVTGITMDFNDAGEVSNIEGGTLTPNGLNIYCMHIKSFISECPATSIFIPKEATIILDADLPLNLLNLLCGECGGEDIVIDMNQHHIIDTNMNFKRTNSSSLVSGSVIFLGVLSKQEAEWIAASNFKEKIICMDKNHPCSSADLAYFQLLSSKYNNSVQVTNEK